MLFRLSEDISVNFGKICIPKKRFLIYKNGQKRYGTRARQMAHRDKLIKGIKKGKKDVDKRDRGVVYYQGTHERVRRTLKIKQRRNKQGKNTLED